MGLQTLIESLVCSPQRQGCRLTQPNLLTSSSNSTELGRPSQGQIVEIIRQRKKQQAHKTPHKPLPLHNNRVNSDPTRHPIPSELSPPPPSLHHPLPATELARVTPPLKPQLVQLPTHP
ncbi:hypothetical protein Pyn_27002 [Prunus yedoensis var. nudiflora]|uniref:Uncharacterized protein n=1 Tax=Prunus yedoensis var. nudiflora TaxID=2094558 RepID=A0A314XGP3_PRUYE|nr:hypothetical protein Pyn_27002 [Prunus yedoensis var. nudiflora]